MSEPLRTAPVDPGPSSDAEREALIERLLLAGLDQYFAANYEQAIDIWTRVAFLEGGQGRARAYIERARGALAERQRRSEELVHEGVAAYHAGDLQTARELLNQALDEGGANETALVFLQRLSRLETATTAPSIGLSGRHFLRSRRAAAPVAGTNWFVTIAASIAVAGTIATAAFPVASWLAETAPATDLPNEPARVEPVPIVRGAEIRLARARELQAAGRLHDALRALDEIGIGDPLRSDADRLRADVQRQLLDAIATPAPSDRGAR